MKVLSGREDYFALLTEHKNIPGRSHKLSGGTDTIKATANGPDDPLCKYYSHMHDLHPHSIAHCSCSNESKRANVQLTQLQRDVKCAHTLRIRYFVQTGTWQSDGVACLCNWVYVTVPAFVKQFPLACVFASQPTINSAALAHPSPLLCDRSSYVGHFLTGKPLKFAQTCT